MSSNCIKPDTVPTHSAKSKWDQLLGQEPPVGVLQLALSLCFITPPHPDPGPDPLPMALSSKKELDPRPVHQAFF